MSTPPLAPSSYAPQLQTLDLTTTTQTTCGCNRLNGVEASTQAKVEQAGIATLVAGQHEEVEPCYVVHYPHYDDPEYVVHYLRYPDDSAVDSL